MTFSTLTFFLFVAVVFALHWSLAGARARNLVLLVASYVFYGWWDVRFCGLVAVSTAIDYLVAQALQGAATPQRRRALLGISVATNLGLLGTFKYYDFFIRSAIEAAAHLGVQLHVETLHLVLPVGISFYTFQTLGYTIDVYRGRLRASRDWVAYSAYVAFFPQLVAGPIERGASLLPQIEGPRRFDHDQAVDGLRQLLWGLFQKVALADNLATLVDSTYGAPTRGPLLALATLCFSFQIYWDFAGYSNMAIGTARLFGIRLSRNFAHPYFSRSVGEHWRRWHITLSNWFRDYVYVPLGGNRHGRTRQAVAVVLTFTLSGLWHGAAWHFVAWGVLNGVLALPSVLGSGRRDGPNDPPRLRGLVDALRMLATFGAICLGWVFFRAATIADAWRILGTIATDALDPAGYASLAAHEDFLRAFLPLTGIVVLVEWVTRHHAHPLTLTRWPRPMRWLLYTAILWSTLYLVPEAPQRFIYFQF